MLLFFRKKIVFEQYQTSANFFWFVFFLLIYLSLTTVGQKFDARWFIMCVTFKDLSVDSFVHD